MPRAHRNLTVNGGCCSSGKGKGPFYNAEAAAGIRSSCPASRVDKGAIKFVLSGANIMCPGLTSPKATALAPAAVDTVVAAIMAEGKQHALCVGVAEDVRGRDRENR